MYKGTILQYLRKYIKNLQADQLESYILSGECTLHSIELEPSAVSDWVSDMFPYTAEVQKVFCSKANIKIPWAQIRTKPLLIAVQQMEITVHVHDFREQEWNVHMAAVQKNRIIGNKISELNEIGNIPNFAKFLKQLELGWTDYMSAGMQVRVEFCRVILMSKSGTRIPPAVGKHECDEESKSLSEAVPAFTVDVEGLFVAPCHHTGSSPNWTVTYVDNPDQAYQFDASTQRLRLSRLITLKSLSISAPGYDKPVVSHSPGFRLRMSSEYTAVRLGKGRVSIPPFPAQSDSAIWIDRVNIDGTCSCVVASFYAILQDLLAPVVVPAEALSPENRHIHYSFREREILRAKSDIELEELKEKVFVVRPESVELAEIPLPPQLPLPVKRTGLVSGKSNELKRLFVGLARDVRQNANKVTERTDTLVTHGRKLLTAAITKLPRKKKLLQPTLSDVSVFHDDSSSPSSSIVGNNRPRKASSVQSETSEFFLDAVSGDDETSPSKRPVSSLYHSEQEEAEDAEGCPEGFALWTTDGSEGDFEVSQMVIVDKLCLPSLFHLHVHELEVRVPSLTVKVRKLDMTAQSQTPFSFAQLTTLAGFCQTPALFVKHARRLAAGVVCTLDPVHAMTAFTVGFLEITTGESAGSLLKLGSVGAAKGVSLKWKSRTGAPARTFLGANISGKKPFDSALVQPFEGCLHSVQISVSGWAPFLAFYTQLTTFVGEFPDPSLDPQMKLRLCLRDVEVTAAASGYRLLMPSGMLSRNVKKGDLGDLLAGLQNLAPIPDCHYSDSPVETNFLQTPFPHDGGFCSCICGQETTAWSWVLPSCAGLPLRVRFPNRVLGTGGLVTERVWKQAQVVEGKSVLVPSPEYALLLEAKLKVAEQQVVIDQLREQYATVMEEVTKRNVFLKEKWAQEAVQEEGAETVVEILTAKVCTMEKYLRELSEEKLVLEKSAVEVRAACVSELATARKSLLEETQKLKFKLADAHTVQQAMAAQAEQKLKEVDTLMKQREFLLGIGVKLTATAGAQTE